MNGIVIMGSATAAQAVLQLVVLAALARVVTPSEFGLATGALIVVFLTTAVAESGIGAALIQRGELTEEHLRAGYLLSVAMALSCCAGLIALAPLIEDLLRLEGVAPLLRVLAFVFVINGLTLSRYLLSRRLQVGRLATAELVSFAVGYGAVSITMAQLGHGAWAIVYGQLGYSALLAVIVTFMAPHPFRFSVARRPLAELLAFGSGLTIGRVAQWGASQMDNVVVGRYLGAAALGLYGRAYQLVQLPANLLGQVANEVLFPAMASVQHDLPRLRRVFGVGSALLAALALPCSLLAVISAPSLVVVLLGRDWLPLLAAFNVIVFGMLFRTSTKLTDALMKARGAVYRRAWRNLVFAGLVFLGARAGTQWGLRGVAVGVLVALGINYVITNQLCLKLVEMSWRDFVVAHVPALILSVAAGSAGLAADRLVAMSDPPAIARLAVTWLTGLLAGVLLVRLASRVRLFRSVARLATAVASMLVGAPATLAARLLGPGYAPMLVSAGVIPDASPEPPRRDPQPPDATHEGAS